MRWPSAETVIVIAKEPMPGRVKTRLQSSFSAAEAALLAEAALADTLAAVNAAPVSRRIVALDGEGGPWIPSGFEVTDQGGGGLDLRLEHAFAYAFADGGADAAAPPPGPVLLIGMDTPQVTPELVTASWRGADAVLGLADDGGFWAVGLRRHVPGAFAGVPMSTPDTGARQLARLQSLGLSVHLLPDLRDVDTPDDAQAVAAQVPGTRFAALHRSLGSGEVVHEHPLELFAAALEGARVAAELPDGQRLPLDVDRWTGVADGADHMLLSRCEGAVLDLGCGPGRLVGALAAAGKPALGVDICRTAVQHTARRGASVLLRSVHDRLPGEGRWGTVLLADGNIGISGDPDALLLRCAELLGDMGLLLVEADADEELDTREHIRLVSGRRRSHPMPWARLGCAAVMAAAERTGFLVVEEWRAEGRVFLALRSPGRPDEGAGDVIDIGENQAQPALSVQPALPVQSGPGRSG